MMKSPKRVKNILIVDDDELVIRCLHRMLAVISPQWKVSTFSKAEDADQALKHTHFDLVIVDNNMPGMTGPSLIQRNRSAQNDALFFILTGENADAVCANVADGILIKPCSLPTLKELLDIAEIRDRKDCCAA